MSCVVPPTTRESSNVTDVEFASLFHNILESSSEYSIIGKDLDGKILFWNMGARRLYGYEPGEVVGKANSHILHTPEDVAAGKPQEILQAALTTGKWEGTITSVRKNGRHFIAHVVITPRRDAAGKAIGYLLISHNITERIRAEESVVKSRDFYLTLFDKFPALIWRSDADAKCDYFNQTWLDFTGRSLEQERGDGWAEGVHPEDLADCRQGFLKAFHSRQSFVLEYRLRRHDGEYRWILDHGSAFRDLAGQFAGYLGSCIDITERKRAEKALEESEARFRRLMDSNVQGVIFWNTKGNIIKANNAFLEIVRYTREDLEAGRINWAAMTPPEYADLDRRALEEIAATGICATFEKEYIRKDGGRAPVLIGGAAFKDNSDEGICFVIDLAERKAAESSLQSSHAQLRALSARLQFVREQESERIAREIHDELGQALTALNMDLNWMCKKLTEQRHRPLRSQLLRRLKTTTTLLEATVRTVQRIATELRPHMLDDLGLPATLEWQAEEFSKRTGIQCRWQQRPTVAIPNREQATALFRIFQEILANVGRHAHAHSVNLKLVRNKGEVVLEVADDGKGFTEKNLLNHTSLGLLGMRERAAFIGGRIEIHSAPGKGTKVTVISPFRLSVKLGKMKTDDSNDSENKNSHC